MHELSLEKNLVAPFSNAIFPEKVEADLIQQGKGGGVFMLNAKKFIGAAVFVLLSFTSGNAHSQADDHGDTTETATALTLGIPVMGRLGLGGGGGYDVDFFRLEITDPTRLIIYTTGSASTGGSLLDDTGTLIAFDQDLRYNRNFRIFAPSLDPGLYYVNVRGFGNGTEAYTLHVNVDEDPDHHGDTTETATALMLDYYDDGSGFTFEAGRIDLEDDVDFFRLVITRTTEVYIKTMGLLDTYGELFDSSMNSIASSDDGFSNLYGFSGNFNLDIFALPEGTYSIKVGSGSGATGAYTLRISVSVNAGTERIASATTLTPGTSQTVTIQSNDNYDIFRLVITSDSQVTIWTTGQLDTFGELIAYRNANAPIPFGTYMTYDGSSGDDSNFRITTTLTPGLYYVEAYGYVGDGETEGTYTLHVDVVPINGGGGDDHGDTRDTATPLTLGTPATGMLISHDDVDLFRLEIINPTRLIIYTTGEGYTKGSLLDDTGTRIAFDEDAGNGDNFKIFTPLLDPGLYYVDVRGYYGNGPYTLHVDVDEVQDHHGDTTETATVLTPNRYGETEEAGRIDAGNDVDFFRLEITRTAQVTIFTTGLLDTEGSLLNDEEALIASNDDGFSNEYGFSGNFNFRIFALPPGTYSVKVGSRDGATGAYTLWVEVDVNADGAERIASATTLTPGTSQTVTVSESDSYNYDIFRLVITSDSQVTIWTTGQGSTYGELFAYRDALIPFGTYIALDYPSGDDPDPNFRITTPLTPGLYYVNVYGYPGGGGTEGTYTLHVDVVPINGGGGDDHGDTRDTATPLMLGTPATGMLIPHDDVDLFRLEIINPTRLIIYTTGEGYTKGSLLDDTGTRIAFDKDAGNGDNFKIFTPLLDTGLYYVDVRGYYGNGPYTLHVDVDEVQDHHGDEIAGATVLTPRRRFGETEEAGRIDAGDDVDFFRLEITRTASVYIETTGLLDTRGELFDSEMNSIAASDDGLSNRYGFSGNFNLYIFALPEGTYYVEVGSKGGETGAYTLFVEVGEVEDDEAQEFADAGPLTPSTPETVSIPAAEDYTYHLFRLVITRNAQVKIYTTGELPAEGQLRLLTYHTGPLSAFLTEIAQVYNDYGSGDDSNFSITATLTPGVYYVNVISYPSQEEASAFTLHVDVVPIKDNGGGNGSGGGSGNDNGGGNGGDSGNGGGNDSGGGAMDGGILLLLLLVCLAGVARSLSLTPHSPRPRLRD